MPCSNTNSHPAWDKLNNTGPPGPQGPPGEQGESGLKGNQGPNGAPIPGLNPLGDYNVQITNEVSLSDNTALGKISVPEAGVTVSYLIDVLKEMGIVYRDPKKWGQLGTQDLLVGAAGKYGVAVSLSADGMTVAVGEPYYDDEGNNNKGRVRVFRYDGDNWGLLGSELVGAAGEQAGRSVSLSEDGMTVAVGAPYYDSFNGRVRVFRYDGDNWGLLGSELVGAVGEQAAGEQAAGEQAGFSVSLSADGKTVAVGAPYYDSFNGRVRVFRYDGDNWGQLGTQALLVGAAGDRAGHSVSLSADGKTVAVGAPYYDDEGNNNKGRVRVFSYNIVRGWTQIGGDLEGAAGDQAGFSVSLSADGKTVAVGAPYYDEVSKGRVQVFEL